MGSQKPKVVEDKLLRRRFPRRPYQRKIGVLASGQFYVCEAGELGEGGVSFTSEYIFSIGKEVLINLQIPGGGFVSLRAIVRRADKEGNAVVHGLSFVDVPFQQRRQIRSFVSDRSKQNLLT